MNIKKVQSIVVNRSFTIYQLANIIKPKIIEQFSADKLIIIGDLLSVFVNDPQGQIKEGECLIIQIINAVIKI